MLFSLLFIVSSCQGLPVGTTTLDVSTSLATPSPSPVPSDTAISVSISPSFDAPTPKPMLSDFVVNWELDNFLLYYDFWWFRSRLTDESFTVKDFCEEDSVGFLQHIAWLEKKPWLVWSTTVPERVDSIFHQDSEWTALEDLVCKYTAVICYKATGGEQPYQVAIYSPKYGGFLPDREALGVAVPLECLETSPGVIYDVIILMIDENATHNSKDPYLRIAVNDCYEEPLIEGNLAFWNYFTFYYNQKLLDQMAGFYE